MIATLVPKDQAPVNESAVKRLEAALEKAKNGELSSVVIVATQVDGGNFSTFSAGVDRLRTIGLLDWVRYRMLTQYEYDI